MTVDCKAKIDALTQPETGTLADTEEVIVCSACHFPITDPSRQILVNDSFSHVFANPHGLVFEIGCFSAARGCQASSIPSQEFSWFIGYSWQIGICRQCAGHLGWIFSDRSSHFYGLILDKLIFP